MTRGKNQDAADRRRARAESDLVSDLELQIALLRSQLAAERSTTRSARRDEKAHEALLTERNALAVRVKDNDTAMVLFVAERDSARDCAHSLYLEAVAAGVSLPASLTAHVMSLDPVWFAANAKIKAVNGANVKLHPRRVWKAEAKTGPTETDLAAINEILHSSRLITDKVQHFDHERNPQ